MRRIRRIISESMLFVCGMATGRCVFGGMEIWKAVVIGMAVFTILWLVWDGITEAEAERKQTRIKTENHKKVREAR